MNNYPDGGYGDDPQDDRECPACCGDDETCKWCEGDGMVSGSTYREYNEWNYAQWCAEQ